MTANPEKNYYLCRKSGKGVMLEWLKWHAWKACIRQKRIGGSNPPRSAINTLIFNKLACLF